MIQVLELRKMKSPDHIHGHSTNRGNGGDDGADDDNDDDDAAFAGYSYELGKGQEIEMDMARSVGIKVFIAKQPCTENKASGTDSSSYLPLPFTEHDIDRLVHEIEDWNLKQYKTHTRTNGRWSVHHTHYLVFVLI